MSNTPPTIGQDPWGTQLNAHLAHLGTRLDAVEARPEYLYNSYAWVYNNGAPPAANQQVRFNNTNLALATAANFRLLDSDGADRTAIFQMIGAGSKIRINDWNNAAVIHRFNVTGPATLDATNAQLPVAWVSGTGTIPNAKASVAFIVVFVPW